MGVTMHQLLKTLVDQGGTDLHITTNSPPQIRIDGKMVPLQVPPLTTPETKNLPVDTVVVGIVDSVHVDQRCVYAKEGNPAED